jgi:hypothetical protein
MTPSLLPTLRQVLAATVPSGTLTTEREAELRLACMDAEATAPTPLEKLALAAARDLLDWTLTTHGAEARLKAVLDAQTAYLMDADTLTADDAMDFTRQYRQVDHQAEVAKAAAARLRLVVEAVFRALERNHPPQLAACATMAEAYMATYHTWLLAYRQERAALDAFANTLADTAA